jgi:hypothetical protein
MMAPMDSPVHDRTTVVENPSADKFGPPPAPSDAGPDGKLRRRLIRLAFGFAVYFVWHWLWNGSRGRTWFPVILLVALELLTVFDALMRRRGKADENEPYSSPTHITR